MNVIVPSDVEPYVDCLRKRQHISPALSKLLLAAEDAQELGMDPWQFAVERETLAVHGLSSADLRWLALKGLLHHAVERPSDGRFERVFDHEVGPTTIGAHTCAVLTPVGVEVARRLAGLEKGSLDRGPVHNTDSLRPVWNDSLRELRMGGLLVKRYRVPADNQQAVIMAFEEEGWPACIDDPLPIKPDRAQRRALHDTITALNRHHAHALIQFSGNGSGEGVCWEYVGAKGRAARVAEVPAV